MLSAISHNTSSFSIFLLIHLGCRSWQRPEWGGPNNEPCYGKQYRNYGATLQDSETTLLTFLFFFPFQIAWRNCSRGYYVSQTPLGNRNRECKECGPGKSEIVPTGQPHATFSFPPFP